MSDKVDKFCEALRVNLTRVEDCIAKVGENLKSASKTAEEEATKRFVEATPIVSDWLGSCDSPPQK